MNHVDITDKTKCSGCCACMNACPHHCISMDPDDEGFLYPHVDRSKCIECGLCMQICPFMKETNEGLFSRNLPDAYALYHRDAEIRKQSTSGGAFTALCESFFASGRYAIFGAAYDENFCVRHSYVNDISDLGKFRKSKYVQSDIGDSYKQVKCMLNEGYQVLFSGTPCQIAGLRSFLRRPYDNLLTVDIICHGVPSLRMLGKYRTFMEARYKDNISKIDFRNKENAGWENSKISVFFYNRKPYERSAETTDDPYMNAFLSGLSLRPSCRPCIFAKGSRVSDITIGDLWGIEVVKPDWDDNKGVSLALVNTPKGNEVIANLGSAALLEPVDFTKAVAFNRHLSAPAQVNPRRGQFMMDLRMLPFEKVILRHLKPRPLINRLASRYLNKKTKKMIKRLLGWI